jgi:hypothetical protein
MKAGCASRSRRPEIALALILAGCGTGPMATVTKQDSDERRMPSWASAADVDPGPDKRHAVVLIIDTLRADSLGPAATPNLDALAARGEVVEHAWSAGTWTVPSVTSMFLGMSVRRHGWDLPSAKLGKYPPIPEDAPTVAEVLRENGFVTAGLYANPYLAEPLGLDRGFDRWKRTPDVAMAAAVEKEVATWTDGKRHFLYIHLLGPHSTLSPSKEARERWKVDEKWIDPKIGFDIGVAKRNQEPGAREAYAAAYHAVVEDTDARVGQILEALKPYEADTALVFTSDHGEMLGEHGIFGHGTQVWEQLTHVPFVAVNAGKLPDTLSAASVADIVTGAAGVRHAWPANRTEDLPLVSQREGLLALSPDGHTRAVWTKSGLQVFDLADDPREERPIAGRDAEMEAARRAWEERVPAGQTSEAHVELSPETIEELRALGYVDE